MSEVFLDYVVNGLAYDILTSIAKILNHIVFKLFLIEFLILRYQPIPFFKVRAVFVQLQHW